MSSSNLIVTRQKSLKRCHEFYCLSNSILNKAGMQVQYKKKKMLYKGIYSVFGKSTMSTTASVPE